MTCIACINIKCIHDQLHIDVQFLLMYIQSASCYRQLIFVLAGYVATVSYSYIQVNCMYGDFVLCHIQSMCTRIVILQNYIIYFHILTIIGVYAYVTGCVENLMFKMIPTGSYRHSMLGQDHCNSSLVCGVWSNCHCSHTIVMYHHI